MVKWKADPSFGRSTRHIHYLLDFREGTPLINKILNCSIIFY